MPAGFRKYRFLLALTIGTMPVVGYLIGNNYYSLIVGFFGIALLDLAVGKDRHNPRQELLADLAEARFYRWILYVYVPVHLALLGWGAMVIGTGGLAPV
ncbi:MAG TPA: hypothetical protein VIW78_00790, partial [Burkholderiales bacterium]